MKIPHMCSIMLVLFTIMGACKKVDAKSDYTIPEKLNWWYEARFGMFIHFGSYSYLGNGEWAFSNDNWTKARYQTEVSAHFNPVNFNGGTIARLAKKAGMKYLVITAKHHEGFCMWDTDVESFKDVTGTKMYDLTGFTDFTSRDLLKELKDSCEAQDVVFNLYYSILDWNHSSQEIYHGEDWYTFSTMASNEARTNYIRDMKAQLQELLTRYQPAVMWFDGDWTYNYDSPTLRDWWTRSDGADLYNYLINLDSDLIVNERVFRGAGLGDFECPEQEVPDTALSRPWETCQTLNKSWGYASWDTEYKSVDSLIHELVRVVSRDGNYLLNIGPKGDGALTEQTVTLLEGVGDWMEVYGESIYGTTRSPYPTEPEWGYYTKKNGKLFAHVFSWPANGILEIPSLVNTINKVYPLNDTATTLTLVENGDYLRISVPTTAPNAANSVVVIDVNGIPSITSVKSVSPQVASGNGSSALKINSVKNGALTIAREDNSSLALTIYTIAGQKVLYTNTVKRNLSLNLQLFSPGIYSVQMVHNGQQFTKHFMLHR